MTNAYVVKGLQMNKYQKEVLLLIEFFKYFSIEGILQEKIKKQTPWLILRVHNTWANPLYRSIMQHSTLLKGINDTLVKLNIDICTYFLYTRGTFFNHRSVYSSHFTLS